MKRFFFSVRLSMKFDKRDRFDRQNLEREKIRSTVQIAPN